MPSPGPGPAPGLPTVPWASPFTLGENVSSTCLCIPQGRHFLDLHLKALCPKTTDGPQYASQFLTRTKFLI